MLKINITVYLLVGSILLALYPAIALVNSACPTATYLANKINDDYLITVTIPTGEIAKYKLHISNIDNQTGDFTYTLFTSRDRVIMKDAEGKLRYKFIKFTIPVNMQNNWLTFYDCNGVFSEDGKSISNCILFERDVFSKPAGCASPPKVDIQVMT
ncbi:MAG: hypothetical protein HYR97_01205 [Candidatus Melainabacteria bacterium]|nr:hypothetical protein [Candidatus Melainabacteria bacterium]MBI3308545.1 hypothetical protein [Candidatus Melainabacteria bacterium]